MKKEKPHARYACYPGIKLRKNSYISNNLYEDRAYFGKQTRKLSLFLFLIVNIFAIATDSIMYPVASQIVPY